MHKIKNLLCGLCLVFIGITAGYAGSVDQVTDRNETVLHVSDIYSSQIGVRELTGRNDGVEVEKYLAVTGFGKGYAWCAAFISWTYQEAEVKALKNAWAPSWFPPGNTIYIKGKSGNKVPGRADVFGIFYPKDNRIGHVGFVDDWPSGEFVITVEGNTNSAGSREGDGVYRKRRLKANIYKVSRWV